MKKIFDNKRYLKGSMTIEASFMMPIVLFTMAMLIAAGFELHDIVVGNFVANEAAELYGHLPEDGDTDSIVSYGNSRLKNVLSDMDYTLEIDGYKDGSRAKLSFEGGAREYEDSGSRPEKMMRALTVLDAVFD